MNPAREREREREGERGRERERERERPLHHHSHASFLLCKIDQANSLEFSWGNKRDDLAKYFVFDVVVVVMWQQQATAFNPLSFPELFWVEPSCSHASRSERPDEPF
jgi:hypothetical protein